MHEKLVLCGLMLLAAALVGAAVYFYNRFAENRAKVESAALTLPNALRRRYERDAGNGLSQTVVYISIYKHRLKSVAPYTAVTAVNKRIRSEIESALSAGLFRAAAEIDGYNYVLLSTADKAQIRAFCEAFMRPKNGRKSGALRYAALLDIYAGAYSPEGAVSFEDALTRARKTARYAGVNHMRFCTSTHEVQAAVGEMEYFENAAPEILDNNEFYMVVQPIVDNTGKMIGGEMLSRFRIKDNRDIAVQKFLQAARREALTGRFDYLVFEKCLAWIETMGPEKLGFITCNFTRLTAASPDFIQNITTIAEKYDFVYSSVAIEITEDDDGGNREQLCKNIETLKDLGFLLLIDDFGAGTTSIDDLYRFPVDIIKIDKTILGRADTEKGAAIFDSISHMAKTLNVKLLCEGIETKEQFEFAAAHGCDLLQGYYFSKPMQISDYEEAFAERV